MLMSPLKCWKKFTIASRLSFSLQGFGNSGGGGSSSGYRPRKANWICPNSSCGETNFGSREECYKCSEAKGDAIDAPEDSNAFKPRQRTEWYCTDSSCGAKNFGNRTECFKCSEPKGDAQDVPSTDSGFKPRANDWICTDSSCGVKNFGSRNECFKCHEPKGDAQDAPAESSGGGGYAPRQRMEWICTDSSCGTKNFGHRTECFKCNEPKGDAQDVPATDSGSRPRANDWICTSSSCGAKNFGSRNECFKCHEPKGDAEDAPADAGGDNRPKDWMCTGCNAKNFGSRSECFKCQEPKGDARDAPEAGAAMADDKPKESYIPVEANEDEIFTMNITTGINFCKLNDIPVTTTGENKPPACKSFSEAGLRQFVVDNIERSGYKMPTPIQQNAIPIISAGRDLMACAQTGSGKTAAFLIPIIDKLLSDEREQQPGSPHVLIVSPTRELVTQVK